MVYNSVTFNPLWLYDWDVRATTRKIVCVGILACAYFAGVSEPSPAQKTTDNVTEFRLNELERRSEKLEFLPDRATRIETNQVEMNKRLDSIDSKAWYLIAALLLATMDRLLGLLYRVRDRAKKTD